MTPCDQYYPLYPVEYFYWHTPNKLLGWTILLFTKTKICLCLFELKLCSCLGVHSVNVKREYKSFWGQIHNTVPFSGYYTEA